MPKISSVRDAKKFWLHPMSLAEVPAKPERRRATFSSRNSCAARSTLLGLPSCPFAEVCRTLEVIRLRPEGFGGRSSLQLLAPLVGKLGGSEQLENYNVFRCSFACQRPLLPVGLNNTPTTIPASPVVRDSPYYMGRNGGGCAELRL